MEFAIVRLDPSPYAPKCVRELAGTRVALQPENIFVCHSSRGASPYVVVVPLDTLEGEPLTKQIIMAVRYLEPSIDSISTTQDSIKAISAG